MPPGRMHCCNFDKGVTWKI